MLSDEMPKQCSVFIKRDHLALIEIFQRKREK